MLEPWTGAQRAFVVKAFNKNGDSFVTDQREFRRELGIHLNPALPSAQAIKTWVRNFEANGSTLKKKETSNSARSQTNSCGDASKSNG